MKTTQWKRVSLGEICKFKYGQMPKKTDLSDEGYPVFSGYGIVGFATSYHYENPEVIVVARGVGGTGDVKFSPPKCFLTNLSIAAQVASPHVDKHFLFYRLNYPSLWELRTGSAQAQITIERLNQHEVDIPPLPTQRKIAKVLSAYDDLIVNNTRRIAILEEMAQKLYKEWFVNFRFPEHENAKFVDSPLGKIPEGWKVEKLKNVAEVNARSIKKGNEPDSINYIDIASVSTGSVDAVQAMSFSESPGRARRIIRHGDIIWSTVRPNRKSYSLILNPLQNMIASTGFAVISGITAPYSYLYYALTTDKFVGYLVSNATGSAYPAVSSADFEKSAILIPSTNILQKFHEFVEPLLVSNHCFARKNTSLRTTRDLLLPKLISGQLDVEDLDIDTLEPLVDA